MEYSGTRGLKTSKLKKMILKIEVVYFKFRLGMKLKIRVPTIFESP